MKVNFINFSDPKDHKFFLLTGGEFVLKQDAINKILQKLTNDEIMINFYRRLSKKYDSYIRTYIITNDYNYFILDTEFICQSPPFSLLIFLLFQ